MKAILIGANGLVGNQVLHILIEDIYFDKIVIIVRKTLNINHPKIQEIILEDFDNLPKIKEQLIGNHYYCCLGTTIKKAKSKSNFFKVDFEYCLAFAKIAKENNASSFNIILANGANKNSMFFYNKVKGQLEEALLALELNNLNIHKPALLLGKRNETRFLEDFFSKILKFLKPVISSNLYNKITTDSNQLAQIIIEKSKTGEQYEN